MSRLLNQGDGCLRKTKTVRRASFKWDMRKPRDRKDLSRLYGMEPVSTEIYDTIMRADNGQATDADYRLLDQYIKEKTSEIRTKKLILGLEGTGARSSPGKLAEIGLINFSYLMKLNEDEDDYE